ncbi:isopentenyl-diphosphate Delta-isomerase [Isoptericola cucumis]|uniref:Isopentenyl-diphosphate Delta-isomerase n=1 Tax=Isoptericola cucumis TaxID=1776856 RepID=A0ABQ2B929_9MICO|nr:isopentenyl-diphosphate Delta-isomerase [Isoptericola cucumis]GGI09134.1 isopentenyl-diphosphate Delta-isomerase [Isoptericola cucumis]
MGGHATDPQDHVVLLDDAGHPVGTAPRATVHTADTPLHLGFSCYLFRADGQVLVTRRALSKSTWPGVWTSSVCGHPRDGESVGQAVRRHGRHELGVDVTALELVLPSFRYRAVDAAGVVENEVCPVLFGFADGPPTPNPDEVLEARWVRMEDLEALVFLTPWMLSPWLVAQMDELLAAGMTTSRTRTPLTRAAG